MRKLLLLIAGLSSIIAAAQTDSAQTEKKFKNFIAKIKTTDNMLVKGLVYPGMTTDGLAISRFTKTNVNSLSPAEIMSIPAENIKSFTIKRKNSVLKGALIGLGIGAVTGVVIGLASGDDPIAQYPDPSTDFLGLGTISVAIQNSFAMTAGEKAVGGGIGLGVTGAIVGTVVGALVKKKFIINGKKEKLRNLQADLMMRLTKK
ncbi:hypothetical protein [Terrimonas alba]|uniref:hypothetical protein n=1 Tax=Terrimonas alba TaxID=3349636 RepID=UPI0035F2ED9E